MTATTTFKVSTILAGSLFLSSCMSMMMSEEQEKSACDSYRSALNNPALTPDQRPSVIQGMNQLDCPNTPAA